MVLTQVGMFSVLEYMFVPYLVAQHAPARMQSTARTWHHVTASIGVLAGRVSISGKGDTRGEEIRHTNLEAGATIYRLR